MITLNAVHSHTRLDGAKGMTAITSMVRVLCMYSFVKTHQAAHRSGCILLYVMLIFFF